MPDTASLEKLIPPNNPALSADYPAAEHGFFYALTRNSQRGAFQDILIFLEAL